MKTFCLQQAFIFMLVKKIGSSENERFVIGIFIRHVFSVNTTGDM